MRISKSKIAALFIGALLFTGCKKNENAESTGYTEDKTIVATEMASDSISYAAKQEIEGKQFVKSADLNLEVKDVYHTTIEIEKFLKTNGGFVTLSALKSQIISDETYNTSDDKAMLVRKFQTENSMEVRVPTEKLGDFLQYINDEKLFLNARNIYAEDITANIQLAKLEAGRIAKAGNEITKLNTTKSKVDLINENESENNYQKINDLQVKDNLKYSTVKIYIKEPKVRVAEIAVTNTRNIDNKYKISFFYDLKNAIVEGFYLIQKIIIGLFTIWPLLLIAGVCVFFYRKRKIRKVVHFNSKVEK